MKQQYDENPISSLIRHCEMYLYAAKGSPDMQMNIFAQDFFQFGLLHLGATMFITTDPTKDTTGGVFHRILDPLGHGKLLKPIDNILDSPLGNTTLRQFLRTKRNKLAVHGSLAFSTQPTEVQDVTFDSKARDQYKEAMGLLDDAIMTLKTELEKIPSK